MSNLPSNAPPSQNGGAVQPMEEPTFVAPTPEEIKLTQDLLDSAAIELILKMPFYGQLLVNLNLECSGVGGNPGQRYGDYISCSTAGVNYETLFICAVSKERNESSLDWKSLSKDARAAVIVHEILHLVFEHLSFPDSFNPTLANIAQDAIINGIILEDPVLGSGLQEIGIENFVRPNKTNTGFLVGDREFIVRDYQKQDWITLYKVAMEQLEKESSGNGKQGSGGNTKQGSGGGGGGKPSIEDIIESLGKSNILQGDTTNMPKHNNGTENSDYSHVDSNGNSLDSKRQMFNNKVIAAAEQCIKNRGTVPLGVERILGKLNQGKVNWRQKFRRLVQTEIAKDDFSHKPVTRKFHLSGNPMRPLVLPKIENETVSDIVAVLDTSGSMGTKELIAGISEFREMRRTQRFNLHFITCDAAVHDHKKFTTWEEPDWEQLPVNGGGGSCFRPAFDYIDKQIETKNMNKPALVVFFTDGWITFREQEPKWKTLILSTTAESEYFPKYAEVIYMDDLKDE